MQKRKHRGFTLVELIVVLVILAILAAILVPALLGYVDRAKKQQIVLNAKNCLTAAQAELTTLYGKSEVGVKTGSSGGVGTITALMDQPEAERIMSTADVPDCTCLIVGTDGTLAQNDRDGYKITFVYYEEGDEAIYFDGTSWIETEEYPLELANTKSIFYIVLDGEY
jgi:prepilin-type N-terminal cleavage/methylation domain-containing protein